MAALSQQFLAAIHGALQSKGIDATHAADLLENKSADFLLFHPRSGRRRPPIAFRLVAGRDNPEALRSFLAAAPIQTRYSAAAKVFVQNVDVAGVEAIVALMLAAFTVEYPAGDVTGVEWLDGWLVFRPWTRLEEVTMYFAAQGIPIPPLRRARRTPVSKEAIAGADAALAAKRPRDSKRSGFVFEHALAKEMESQGMRFDASEFLDVRKKTDFLITHCPEVKSFRPIALQVTLRWNDLLKMRSFTTRSPTVLARKKAAIRLYLQIARGAEPARVVAALKDFARSQCSMATGGRTVFAEFDDDGLRVFSAKERVHALSARANPRLTGHMRKRGKVTSVESNGILIRSSHSEQFWAFSSEIADRSLYQDFRSHLRGSGDLIGAQVSFIPVADRKKKTVFAQSVISSA